MHTNTHRAYICRERFWRFSVSFSQSDVLVNSDTNCAYKHEEDVEKPGHVPEMLVGSAPQLPSLLDKQDNEISQGSKTATKRKQRCRERPTGGAPNRV